MPFISNSHIKPLFLLVLFGLHVGTGLLHNWIAWHYYPEHGDIWNFFQLSFLYRHRLTSDFQLFLSDNSTWTYVTHNGIIWIHMVLDLLSFDNLQINTLLFAFPVFLGTIALYRLFSHYFPQKPAAALCVFLLPSVLFWTSCIHREGLIYMLLGMLFYLFHRLLTRGPDLKRILYILLCFALIMYFRSVVALALTPALLIWWLAGRRPNRIPLLFTGCCLALLLLVLFIPGHLQFIPATLAARQHEFVILEGHSRLPLPILDGSWSSLIHSVPVALLNGLFEPLPGSGGQLIYTAFAIELLFIWAIILFALIRRFVSTDRASKPTPPPLTNPPPNTLPFSLCCVVFALIGMAFVGLMVPFAGAIVRYRSIYLPFLLLPLFASLPFHRLNHWLSQRILKN
jgi:hypothetical protein